MLRFCRTLCRRITTTARFVTGNVPRRSRQCRPIIVVLQLSLEITATSRGQLQRLSQTCDALHRRRSAIKDLVQVYSRRRRREETTRRGMHDLPHQHHQSRNTARTETRRADHGMHGVSQQGWSTAGSKQRANGARKEPQLHVCLLSRVKRRQPRSARESLPDRAAPAAQTPGHQMRKRFLPQRRKGAKEGARYSITCLCVFLCAFASLREYFFARVALAQGPQIDYSKFLHNSQRHSSLACNSCHERTDNSATPRFPGHKACTDCHRGQFTTPQSRCA